MVRRIAWVETSRSTADTRTRFATPTGPTRNSTQSGPAMAPALPPAATKPKSRFPWSVVKRSTSSDQKTETTKRP